MINKWIGVGRVANDIEIGNLEQKVAKFRLATSEKYKNKAGEIVENTDFHSIVCWNNVAEICEKYVKKGDLIYCEGKVKNRNWEDKEGIKHYVTEIVVDTVRLLTPKQKEEIRPAGNSNQVGGTSQPQPVVFGGNPQPNFSDPKEQVKYMSKENDKDILPF